MSIIQIRIIALNTATGEKYTGLYDGDHYCAEVIRNTCVNLSLDPDMIHGMVQNVDVKVRDKQNGILLPFLYNEYDDISSALRALGMKMIDETQKGVSILKLEVTPVLQATPSSIASSSSSLSSSSSSK